MLKGLSIFSFRIISSGLFWTFIAVLCIESWCWKSFPSRYFSHEVDHLMYNLQTRIFDADTIVLGDSVGGQISTYISDQGKRDFISLATTGAMQMAGQYYILLRYLERNKSPKAVILLKHNPLRGDLNRPATENYVQRSFTRWHEIAEMTWQTGSPSFGLRTLSYNLATAKYRLHLHKLIPGLETPEVGGDPQMAIARLKMLNKTTMIKSIMNWFMPQELNSISEYYLLRLLDECQRKNIRFYYMPCPMPDKKWTEYRHGLSYKRLVLRIKELSFLYPNLIYTTEIKTYPEDWFVDGVHVEESRLPQVAEDYTRIMDDLMLP